MIAQAVEEAIRIGRDAWRGERHKRAKRRRWAFERKLLEQVAIHIGVRRRVRFDQIAARLHVHGSVAVPIFRLIFAWTGMAERTDTS